MWLQSYNPYAKGLLSKPKVIKGKSERLHESITDWPIPLPAQEIAMFIFFN